MPGEVEGVKTSPLGTPLDQTPEQLAERARKYAPRVYKAIRSQERQRLEEELEQSQLDVLERAQRPVNEVELVHRAKHDGEVRQAERQRVREALLGDDALLAAYIAGVGQPADEDAARANARPFIEAALDFLEDEDGLS